MLRQRDPREVLRGRERALSECHRRLDRAVETAVRRVVTDRTRVREGGERLGATIARALRDYQRGLDDRTARLRALGPEQTLGRGYSICVDGEDGRVIRAASETAPGQGVKVVLSAGRLDCTVDEAHG